MPQRGLSEAEQHRKAVRATRRMITRGEAPGFRSLRAEQGRPGVAVAAAGVGAGLDVAYVLLIHSQGSEIALRVVFFASFVGVMAALSLAGAHVRRQDERVAQALLYGAATGYLLAGVLGLMSVGLPLILAGLLAFAAAGPRRVSVRAAAAVVAISASVFVIGIALT